jgi:diguanylate cyclase (GGDEF)-like protein
MVDSRMTLDLLVIIVPVLFIIAAVIIGFVSYRRGKVNGRTEREKPDNKGQLEALREDMLSKDKQLNILQGRIQNLSNAEKSQIKRIESLEDKLRQKGREISLLSETSLFLTTVDFQKTCDLVAQRVGFLPHVKFTRLYLVNDEGTMLRLVSGYNISEKYIQMIKDEFEFSVNNIPAGMAVTSMMPFVVDDVYKNDYFSRWGEITALYDYRSYVAIPLLRTNRIIGVVEIFLEKENVLTKDSLDIINIIANMGALAIENCFFTGKLQELSIMDEMTSVYNHRFLTETFDKEIERAARHKHHLSYVMIDLDNFKPINDTLGHVKGNEVLKSVAKVLKNTVRTTDYVCRYGGDEFAILLLETDREEMLKVIMKLRAAALPLWKSLPPGTDMSIGFAVYPEDGSTSEDLIRYADSLIYEEKQKKKAR